MATAITNMQEFSTDVFSEVKEFTWTIKNFPLVVALDEEMDKVKMIFKAGESIGLPTRWQIYFQKTENKLGIFATLLESPAARKTIFARTRFKIVTDKHFQFTDLKAQKFPKDHKKSDWGNPSFIESISELVDPTSEKSLLVDRTLMIRVQLTLYNDDLQAKLGDETDFYVGSGITEDLEKLLDAGEDADITFQFEDGQTLKAHSLILKARSPIFSAMLRAQMTESTSGVVLIKDVSLEAMMTVLKFIYTDKTDVNWNKNIKEIIYTADKYELLSLKKLCDNRLRNICTPDTAWELLELAELHELKIAEGQIKTYIKENFEELMQAKKRKARKVQ